MKSSRKTAEKMPRGRANWHRLELPVPDSSRLTTMAGGLPDREPPRTNGIVEQLAAALLEASADGFPATWVVAPSRRVGNQWIETLARTGHPVVNVHVTTLSALAYDIVAETLARDGLEFAPPRAKLVILEQLLVEHRDTLEAFGSVSNTASLAGSLIASIETLRMAGLSPHAVAKGLRNTPKGRDIRLLMERYAVSLEEMGLVDGADEFTLAVEHVRNGRLPSPLGRLLVPDDLDLRPVETTLLQAIELQAIRSSGAVDVRRIASDPPLPNDPAAIDAKRVAIVRAAGESNEVRHVLRTCLRLGLAFDEVEIVHTDRSTYPALVREIVAALPAADDSPLPVTFAEGLPLADSRPGRALTEWLQWRRDGHPQAGLERLLQDGLVAAPSNPGASAGVPSGNALSGGVHGLARELRGVRAGRGLERLRALVAASLSRVREQPAEAFARGSADDSADDATEELGADATELLGEKKRARADRLAAIQAIVDQLAACEASEDGLAILAGARTFLETLTASTSEFDGNARKLLLDEIDDMQRWQEHRRRAAGSAASPRDMFDWLERLPKDLVVLGSGPRAGCLHVTGLADGGQSGRPYTFVLGLDENRFPGAGSADPVLPDGDRALINAAHPHAALPTTRDASARTLLLWRRLLGRTRGRVWLSFSCRDSSEDAETFPSPALVALHGQLTANPSATLEDLLRAIPPPESYVPFDPASGLDETQRRLAALGPTASADQVAAALAAHRAHLAAGWAAEAARTTDRFTPHDGHVPEAGPRLDPRGSHGRIASSRSLETLGACPRRFFFRYGLGIEPVESFDDDADRWLDARDAGSLLHGVLERFMRRIIDRGEIPTVDLHLNELLVILDEDLEASRRKHPPLTELSFAARRAELVTAMQTFLHDEERSCRETGSRPVALEAAIGLEPAEKGTPFDHREPVTVSLADGETIRLAGRIDRIDRIAPTGSSESESGEASYLLWDYKSGSGFGFPASAAADPFDGGRKLQHGLYLLMLRERLADSGCALRGGRVVRFGYFFPTRAGRGRRLEWSSEQLEGCGPLVQRLAEIVRQGAFLPTSRAADCTHCDFQSVCGDSKHVAHDATRMLAASEALARLFEGLRSAPRPAPRLDRRLVHDAPLVLTPQAEICDTPPDEPVRKRIREDLTTTLLVEAAAGTGKTTCMVDRMLALVRTGTAKPERIVAVTFTKKAAAELRRRFRTKLQDAAVSATDAAEHRRLTDALDRVDGMVIGTIHSFAGRLLRERPIESGVDPGFRELDDAADRLLRREAWRNFVTAAPHDHPELMAMLDAVGLRLGDFSRLFIDRFATYGDIERWPAPETPPPDTAAILASLEEFCGRIEDEAFPPPAARGSDELMTSLEQFARMFRRLDRTSIVAIMDLVQELDRTPKLTQAPWPGSGDTEAEVKASRKARALAWEAAWTSMRETVAQPTLWQWRAHRYPRAVEVLQEALQAYDRLREERGLVSFQDLLCRAAAVLRRSPDVRKSFRDRYTHILVDEFQDTDPVQAQMLLLLTADDPTEQEWRRCRPVPGSLFVVGDPKQSLYRFRRADIVTYSTVRSIVASHGDVLSLTTNFRGRQDLVAWANRVFEREFPAEATMHSPSFTASSSGRREPATGPEAATHEWLCGLRTLRFVRAGTAGDAWAEQEAREIAAFIRGAIDAGLRVPRTAAEADEGVAAACRPRDFLIIARERRHLGVYAAALQSVGLPVDVTGTLGEDQAEPLRELRGCLAVLVDPDDPVPTLALLRGGVFGFSDAELFAYRTAGGRFAAAIDPPRGIDDELRGRFAAARTAIDRWRQWARRLPVAAAVERIVDDAGLALIASHAAGEAGPTGRAMAGLLCKFVERIRNERLEVVSIHDCLHLLDDMIDPAARPEFDPLTIDVPDGDRVRVMNLHKAKGLEAPVVFLADFQCREPGDKPEDGPWLHIDRSGDVTEGFLAVTTPYGRSQRIVAAPPRWPELCRRERDFEIAEQIRLDYVAATRPGCCLVVSLFEKHDAGTKSRPESYDAEGAWKRFASPLSDAADLPPPPRASDSVASPLAPREGLPIDRPKQQSLFTSDRAPSVGDDIPRLIARAATPTFARISPREVLTEPAEGIRFTGDGLGEPWGRAIHRLLELASHAPALDLEAAARTALSNESISPSHVARAIETVRDVMASDVWRRSQASRRRYVEAPFSIQVPGEDLPERIRPLAGDGGATLPTVVRGVIDLVFEEPEGPRAGHWTVVDWKTDSVHAASESLLEEHYRPQVELYADCWRCLTGRLSSRASPSPRGSS